MLLQMADMSVYLSVYLVCISIYLYVFCLFAYPFINQSLFIFTYIMYSCIYIIQKIKYSINVYDESFSHDASKINALLNINF